MTSEQTILLATRNRRKLKELTTLLANLPVEVKTIDDYSSLPQVDETGETFEENARLKALTLARSAGCWALADDSGLEVAALSGSPGVYSARFGGADATDEMNRRCLLEALKGVPRAERQGRFVCVVALANPSGVVAECRGECDGQILEEERGSGGFGYDSLFWIAPLDKSMAELTPTQKHSISHRGKALQALLPILKAHLLRSNLNGVGSV